MNILDERNATFVLYKLYGYGGKVTVYIKLKYKTDSWLGIFGIKIVARPE